MFGDLTPSERAELARLLGRVRSGHDAATPEPAEAL
jgi:hypothetical protein